jgi:hypothetical protein
MTSQIRRETAQILQFPPPGQRGRSNGSFQANLKHKLDMFEMTPAVNTGAWYHDAAISAPDRPRKS